MKPQRLDPMKAERVAWGAEMAAEMLEKKSALCDAWLGTQEPVQHTLSEGWVHERCVEAKYAKPTASKPTEAPVETPTLPGI